jgi:prepilin signal peptidase PulO-like enzyme (type II secretory pathway)
LGACVGSFLNVVIYRWPRRLSLVHPGSQCPLCQHPIRWYHNLPILSWIALKGRCHDCGAAISVRYPIVEAFTGGMFVAVALAGPLSFGIEWPFFLSGADAWIAAARWTIWGYHVFLLCMLFCLGMIQWDTAGQSLRRDPWPIWTVGLVIGVAVPLFAALAIVAVPADETLAQLISLDAVPGVATSHYLSKRLGESIGGFVGGLVLGLALVIFRPSANHPLRKQEAWSALGISFVLVSFLGMEAFLEIASATAAVFFVTSGRLRSKPLLFTWSLYLFGTTLAWLVVWKPLAGWQPLLEPEPQLMLHLAMTAAILVFVLGAWFRCR